MIFIIVLSCSPIINIFHWRSSVDWLYFIGCILNDVFLKICHYFLLFLSTSGALSVKTGGNRLPVIYKIKSATVFYIQLMVSLIRYYALRVFKFPFTFWKVIAYFVSSSCFLVEIPHYWQVQLKTDIVEKVSVLFNFWVSFCCQV